MSASAREQYLVSTAPAEAGSPLPADHFETWSQLVAPHYNAPLQQWFLLQERYVIYDVDRMTGTQLIKLGYQTC
jgi:hypothetical protein